MEVYSHSVIVFFKQKTAYDMRISDWSSDVCSSDLGAHRQRRQHRGIPLGRGLPYGRELPSTRHSGRRLQHRRHAGVVATSRGGLGVGRNNRLCAEFPGQVQQEGRPSPDPARSEEHTSELQSLMRISYAVFCLKKKIKKDTDGNNTQNTKTP